MEQTWSDIENLGSGIFVYKNLLTEDLNIINRLEDCLSDTSDKMFTWQPAYVGYRQLIPEYRDCVDYKFKKTDLMPYQSEKSTNLQNLWQDIYDRKKEAVADYCRKFNIADLRYWEAFNFIKYEPGNHFMEHHDHSFSYNCTVSLVGYINDNYDGGELYFKLQGITYKPQAGDLVIFPSNYMYPHQAMPVKSGTKYSIVTMLDYSDKYHNPKFYQETGT